MARSARISGRASRGTLISPLAHGHWEWQARTIVVVRTIGRAADGPPAAFAAIVGARFAGDPLAGPEGKIGTDQESRQSPFAEWQAHEEAQSPFPARLTGHAIQLYLGFRFVEAANALAGPANTMVRAFGVKVSTAIEACALSRVPALATQVHWLSPDNLWRCSKHQPTAFGG